MEITPQYKQTGCNKCIFLGTHEKYDLYFCNAIRSKPTVIAKFGDNPTDYILALAINESLYAFNQTHPLYEAFKRAKDLGYVGKE